MPRSLAVGNPRTKLTKLVVKIVLFFQVASLGLVSPGAANDGVTLFFSGKN